MRADKTLTPTGLTTRGHGTHAVRSFISRNNNPRKKNQMNNITRRIPTRWDVVPHSATHLDTVHTEPLIGYVPLGVATQCCEIAMSPIVASQGSGSPPW